MASERVKEPNSTTHTLYPDARAQRPAITHVHCRNPDARAQRPAITHVHRRNHTHTTKHYMLTHATKDEPILPWACAA